MPRYIALLRGINLAGQRRVTMAVLRDFFVSQGLSDVETLLQSGNVVFSCPRRTPAQLERLLERSAGGTLALEVEVFVRSAAEWASIVQRNPFEQEARADPSHVVMMALKTAPSAADVRNLTRAHQGPEPLHVDGREVYVHYVDGLAASKLATMLDRKLGTRGTARNWNTVLKLLGRVNG